MRKLIPIIAIILLITASQQAAAFTSAITSQELQDNMTLILPSASSLESLEYHSNWTEIEYIETSYGISAQYEALYDDKYSLSTELPTIYQYIVAYESEYDLQLAFDDFLANEKFETGEWILLEETETSFSYKTGAGSDIDLIMDYSSESNTIHYVTQQDNLLIVVNFYRSGGVYNRGNVLAYEEYILNYEDTLSVLMSAASYTKEAIDFYLDDIETTGTPEDYDYYLTSSDYYLALNDFYSIPLNGSIEFDIYIDETSEIGTILDTKGINNPEYGSISLGIDENAFLDFNLYDPYTESGCDDSSGWHHIYSSEQTDLYEWTNIKIEYGADTGMNIYVNDYLQAHCEVYTDRSDEVLYLGDYPIDIIEESFVGYIKDIATSYSLNEDGERIDDVIAEYTIFTDVGEDHQYAVAIEYLKDNGIINGYPDGSFQPDQEVNRAEILKMLLLGFGYDVPEADSENPFSDVETGSWYEGYVLYAYDLEIIAGYADETFKPAQNVNKVEFLKILTRSYGIDLTDYPVTLLYGDTMMTEWYAPYVQYSKDNELMDVGEDGYFYPENPVTRGEVAETIYRMINL